MNRLLKIWKPVPMSGDITLSRSRTWHFSHTLYTSLKPEAARGLSPTSSIDPWDFIKRMFDDLFKQGPEADLYIHLRVSREAVRRSIIVSHAGGLIPLCQIFHFRASSAIRKTILQRWLDAIWTPVGSKLYCDPHYRKEFMEPTNNAAFVYFLVRGGACPRDGRKKKTTAHGSSGNNFCHNV